MIHHHEISEHWGKETLKSEGAGRRERNIKIVHRGWTIRFVFACSDKQHWEQEDSRATPSRF